MGGAVVIQQENILNAFWVNNPVMQAELRHQQRVIVTSRSGRFWIALAVIMLVPALIAALLYVVGAFTGADVSALWNTGGYSVGLHLMIMNLALYVVVTLVTMGLAANSISREQTGKTWETLLITTLDTQQIILGKWSATLRALWGDQIMLALLRVGLVSAAAIAETQIFSPFTPRPDLVFLLIGIAFVLAYSALEAGFSAALGLLTPLSGAGWLFVGVLIVRGAVSVGVVLLVYWISDLLFGLRPWNTIIAALVGLAVLALLTWGVLRAAEWITGRAAPRKAANHPAA